MDAVGGVAGDAEFDGVAGGGDVEVFADEDGLGAGDLEEAGLDGGRQAGGGAGGLAGVVGDAGGGEGGGDGGVGAEGGGEAGEAAGGEVVGGDADGGAVGEAEAFHDEDGVAGGDLEGGGDGGGGGALGEVEELAAGFAVVAADPFAEAGAAGDGVVEHFVGHEGAAALLGAEQAGADEVFDGAADGVAVDGEAGGELGLGGEAVAGLPAAGADGGGEVVGDLAPTGGGFGCGGGGRLGGHGSVTGVGLTVSGAGRSCLDKFGGVDVG